MRFYTTPTPLSIYCHMVEQERATTVKLQSELAWLRYPRKFFKRWQAALDRLNFLIDERGSMFPIFRKMKWNAVLDHIRDRIVRNAFRAWETIEKVFSDMLWRQAFAACPLFLLKYWQREESDVLMKRTTILRMIMNWEIFARVITAVRHPSYTKKMKVVLQLIL